MTRHQQNVAATNKEEHFTSSTKAKNNKLKNMTSNIFTMQEEDRSAAPRTNRKQQEQEESKVPLTSSVDLNIGSRKCSRRNPVMEGSEISVSSLVPSPSQAYSPIKPA